MTPRIAWMLLEATLSGIGIGLVWRSTSWITALGLFLALWGNNMAVSNRLRQRTRGPR